MERSRAHLPLTPSSENMELLPMKLHPVVFLFASVVLSGACAGNSQRPTSPPHREAAVRPEDLVDLNHATLEQLMKVPGLTRTWAERIIRFRPYRTKLDLIEEGVLPGDVYIRIRDRVIAHRNKD